MALLCAAPCTSACSTVSVDFIYDYRVKNKITKKLEDGDSRALNQGQGPVSMMSREIAQAAHS